MTNREKYRFEDFTLSNYSRLLDIAIENGFVFSDYSLHAVKQDGQREIVWRHGARAMAIELAPKRLGSIAYLRGLWKTLP